MMLYVRELYGEEYDMSVRADDPIKSIMLATVPRSGSTYFSLRMWSAGIFGAPLEYLNANSNLPIFGRLFEGSYEQYWRQVQRLRQTPNGVFSYKMFISNYSHIKDNEPNFLKHIAPTFVVYLTREDKVGQAISYARAIQTQRWFAAVPDCAEPSYSFQAIQEQKESIVEQEASWEALFELTGTTPYRVTYEQVLSSCDEVIEGLATFVDERLDGTSSFEIGSIERQADVISDDWRRRYLEDCSVMEKAQTIAHGTTPGLGERASIKLG